MPHSATRPITFAIGPSRFSIIVVVVSTFFDLCAEINHTCSIRTHMHARKHVSRHASSNTTHRPQQLEIEMGDFHKHRTIQMISHRESHTDGSTTRDTPDRLSHGGCKTRLWALAPGRFVSQNGSGRFGRLSVGPTLQTNLHRDADANNIEPRRCGQVRDNEPKWLRITFASRFTSPCGRTTQPHHTGTHTFAPVRYA